MVQKCWLIDRRGESDDAAETMTEDQDRTTIAFVPYERREIEHVELQSERSHESRVLVATSVVGDNVKLRQPPSYASKRSAAIERAVNAHDRAARILNASLEHEWSIGVRPLSNVETRCSGY